MPLRTVTDQKRHILIIGIGYGYIRMIFETDNIRYKLFPYRNPLLDNEFMPVLFIICFFSHITARYHIQIIIYTPVFDTRKGNCLKHIVQTIPFHITVQVSSLAISAHVPRGMLI